MTKEKFSATVFFRPGTLKPRKYRNITQLGRFEAYNGTLKPRKYRNITQLGRFEAYMRHKGAYYANYYNEKGEFVRRVWLQNFS